MSRSSRRVAPPGDAEPRLAAFRGHGAAWPSDLAHRGARLPAIRPACALTCRLVGAPRGTTRKISESIAGTRTTAYAPSSFLLYSRIAPLLGTESLLHRA